MTFIDKVSYRDIKTNVTESDVVCELLQKHRAINQRCFSRMKINDPSKYENSMRTIPRGFTDTNINHLGNAVFVCVNCYLHALK